VFMRRHKSNVRTCRSEDDELPPIFDAFILKTAQ
jgi:hypothetical protein